MSLTRIPLAQTGRFNRLILDYVSNSASTKTFYDLPHERNSYKEQMRSRSMYPADRQLLVRSLLRQYEVIGGCEGLVLENVNALQKENVFTVTTGHQLNIFTGPLYFIYKIVHVIRLAEELAKAYPEDRFVPVYWMNAEDHDLEEIGHFNLFDRNYKWQTEQTGATGRMDPSGLKAFCVQLDAIFSNSPETLELIRLFEKAYTEFGTLAHATRYFVNELFGKYGLVIIDGDDPDLKHSFSSFFRQDILEGKPFELVRKASLQLDGDYHVQVNPRQINTFYLNGSQRERIVRTDKGFHVLHTDIRFTEDQIIAELEQFPERFSPNVVLRPLFQEFVLPNLSYVGGAGELSYWLQYRDYFKEMNVSFPILSLRNHFLVLDRSNGSRMDSLNLFPNDLFKPVDELVRDHLFKVIDTELDLTEELRLLAQLYAQLKSKAADTDASLVSALEAEEKRQEKTIEQWKSRFSRVLKQQNEVTIAQVKRLHGKLFPLGYLQERHDNFLGLYSKYGEGFVDAIHEHTDPFSTEFQVLRLD